MTNNTIYTKEEALKQSKEYFHGDELAADVFVGKYALRNDKNELLEANPDQMHRRIAKEFARIEAKYPNALTEEEIYGYLKEFSAIIPQGSPMSGIGNNYYVQSLGNCFVLPKPLDSYSSICKTDEMLVQLSKRRAGLGFSISNIRPIGTPTKNAARTSTGIGPFMERFSNSIREVGQNNRRGALLMSISVHHPEIDTFIKIKKDKTKVTGANISIELTDEFMNAVKNNEKYEQRWPIDSKTPKISKFVDAKKVWDNIIESAWESAEPGLFFWDNVLKNSSANAYAKIDSDFLEVGSNPCFAGDTLIATADGRNAVSIKQLAEEGKDVPVYSVDPKTGLVSIKTGRNPRITGHNQKLLRINLDDGSHFDVTPNHKILLKDGSIIEAQNLKVGSSLPRFSKTKQNTAKDSQPYWIINCDINKYNGKRVFEHRLIAEFNNPNLWKEKYNATKKNGWLEGGLVVHHKDYNGLNNSPDNLAIMTFKEHQKFHAEHDNAGENNGRCYEVTNDQLKDHALLLSKQLGRKFSTKEWLKYAKANNLPQAFTNYRRTAIGSVQELAIWAAIECGYEYLNEDPRIVKTLQKMIEQGYTSKIEDNKVFIEKTCEYCSLKFWMYFEKREGAFCSVNCALKKINSNYKTTSARIAKSQKTHETNAEKRKVEQAKIFSQLKFTLKRNPLQEEWEEECKKNNISYRVGRKIKYGFKSWREVKEAGSNYNHKVTSIEELQGEHIVYNITVDDNHTVPVITSTFDKELGLCYSGIFTPNCGEILMGVDSCRLLLINLMNFVKNPFANKLATFDFDKFSIVTKIAQRLMDDLIDLEIECIDKILKKIESDPEPEEFKTTEKNMWLRFKKNCINGRRTGLGITALGDVMASLYVKYGSDESIKLTEKIYKHLCINAYESSVQLAKERGAFPIWNLEIDNEMPYVQKILKELSNESLEDYKKYGRRHIALTTTAPAGSVSLLAKLGELNGKKYFQTTSGIEPAFLIEFKRRRKINPNDVNAKVDFIDAMGDKWIEYTVSHPGYKMWKDTGDLVYKAQTNGEQIYWDPKPENSPYWQATSNDVDWKASVELQAAAQKFVDHSLSKTCVTNDMLIETKDGLKYVDELYDNQKIFCGEEEKVSFDVLTHTNVFQNCNTVINQGIKPVFSLKLNNGLVLKATPDEKILKLNEETGECEWIELQKLEIGDRVRIS